LTQISTYRCPGTCRSGTNDTTDADADTETEQMPLQSACAHRRYPTFDTFDCRSPQCPLSPSISTQGTKIYKLRWSFWL